jgi:hypothetical protein
MSVDRIISVESGGNPYARNPRSSATGAGQFLDGTWLAMIGKYRPDLAEGKSKAEILGMRTDPALSREMTEAYAAENAGVLGNAGYEATPGNTYLAHFAGPQGAVKVLGADPSTPVAAIMGEAAVKANPFLANMTAGDLVAWANKKMGGKAAPVAPAQPSAPAGLLAHQQPAPVGGLLSQPQLSSGGGGLLATPEPQQMALQEAALPQMRKRKIDLSGLRALASKYA